MTLIYKTISAVQGELASIGIAKDSKNQMQGFMFRGIDAVMNTLAPLLAKHKLCILPRVKNRQVTERTTAKGTVLIYVTIEVEYDFVAEDGSKHTVSVYGEAMDTGDKATNKAMSIAYKYAAFQAFCIPVEDSDPDSNIHKLASAKSVPKETFDALSADEKATIVEISTMILNSFEENQLETVKDNWYSIEDNDVKIAVWSQLPSNVRSAIKKMKEEK